MSAPTVERTGQTGSSGATTRRAAAPAQRTGPRSDFRTGSAAIGRAYARRAGRQQRMAEPDANRAVSRSRFVLMVMGLFGAGLVASLWLSTSAAADSYRLEEATRATRDLSERSETLRTEIATMRSAPALAQAARELGMVPTSDVARLVARKDGSVVIVGTPKAGMAPAPVLPPMPEGMVPGQPGVVAGQPGVVAGQPSAVAGQPGALSGQTGVVAGQPGVMAAPGGAAPGQSGAYGTQVPGQTAVVPGQAGYRAQVPGQQAQVVPGQQPQQSQQAYGRQSQPAAGQQPTAGQQPAAGQQPTAGQQSQPAAAPRAAGQPGRLAAGPTR